VIGVFNSAVHHRVEYECCAGADAYLFKADSTRWFRDAVAKRLRDRS
jgi:hypothetical protein